MDSVNWKAKKRKMSSVVEDSGDASTTAAAAAASTAASAAASAALQQMWPQIQDEIRLRVDQCMRVFYTIHSEALMRLERVIEQELLPKLEGNGNGSGELHQIREMMQQLLERVEQLSPAEKDDRIAKSMHSQPSLNGIQMPGCSRASQNQSAAEPIRLGADILFYNPQCTWPSLSEGEMLLLQRRHNPSYQVGVPSGSELESPTSRIQSDRERNQLEANLMMMKSQISLNINYQNFFLPRNQGPIRRSPAGHIHEPRDANFGGES
ncbi:uncharacterized protein LOC108095553 [Drosophila ficusphila]|uniref:uncharacterized protein LOC108095553 n=1 Tax=Drosophila ficusphila TaxID=30025 RepID=UPI0007E76634|nr:uncharacterized protein LOC108095553 [Drosophila ficusphila]